MKWFRAVAGLLAGGLNLFANGTNWKQILVSLGLGALGLVTSVTSTANVPATGASTNAGPK